MYSTVSNFSPTASTDGVESLCTEPVSDVPDDELDSLGAGGFVEHNALGT